LVGGWLAGWLISTAGLSVGCRPPRTWQVNELCKKMGVKLGKKGLQQAMARMDKDGGGEVDFEEFSA
jgi:hypothetical protein